VNYAVLFPVDGDETGIFAIQRFGLNDDVWNVSPSSVTAALRSGTEAANNAVVRLQSFRKGYKPWSVFLGEFDL